MLSMHGSMRSERLKMSLEKILMKWSSEKDLVTTRDGERGRVKTDVGIFMKDLSNGEKIGTQVGDMEYITKLEFVATV